MDANAEELLKFQVKRNVTVLFKQFLIILEDLAQEHDIALDKLIDKLPPEYKDYVDLADYFTPEKSKLLRTKVLSVGNDCGRMLEDELSKYEIKFKKE